MTLPRPSKSRRRLASRSKIIPRAMVAFLATFFTTVILQNEASHNLDSHLRHVDHTNLPPPHGGGQGTNTLTSTTDSTRKPRVVAITSLQYNESKSDSDPRPVLVPSSKLLALDTTSLATNKASFHFTESSMPTSGNFIDFSWYTPSAHELLWYNDRCEVMYPWQLEGFPNCNDFHELDMAHMKMINSGGSRTAYEMNQNLDGGMQSKFVYKTVKYKYEVEKSVIDEQRKDALVMERATISNFIPNIHGYCSVGVLMDFMPEGDMNDYLKGARLAKKRGGDESLSPVDRLRVAIHIASSVRDLHEIGDVKEIPAFFHNDIFCHQYLFQDGIFKLNDFNLAQPMTFAKKNTTENEICLQNSSGMKLWKRRSFEEFLGVSRMQGLNRSVETRRTFT